MGSNSGEFTILGQKVVIRDRSEADLASAALSVVESKIAAIQSTHPKLGEQKVALLALLEIAGELVRDRQSMDLYREELDQKCTSLMTELTQMSRFTESSA